MPYSYQTSIGMQRQLGDVMAIEVDYVYTGGRHERSARAQPGMNFNLTYDAATGINYPFTNIARRAVPELGRRADGDHGAAVQLPCAACRRSRSA